MSAPLTFGSLFSGCGGMDLGLELAGRLLDGREHSEYPAVEARP